MSKFSVKFCLAFLVVALLTSAAFAADLEKTYDLKGKFSFKHPASWTPMEQSAAPTTSVTMIDPAGQGFSFVAMLTEGVPADTPLMTKEQAEAAFSNMGSDFKMIEYGPVKIGGKDAILLEYSLNMNGMQTQNRQIMMLNGTDSIVFTSAFVNPANLAELHKIVEAVEASVEFK